MVRASPFGRFPSFNFRPPNTARPMVSLRFLCLLTKLRLLLRIFTIFSRIFCENMLLNTPYLSFLQRVCRDGRTAIVTSLRCGGSRLSPRRLRWQAAAPAMPRFKTSNTPKSSVELITWSWCSCISATAPANTAGFLRDDYRPFSCRYPLFSLALRTVLLFLVLWFLFFHELLCNGRVEPSPSLSNGVQLLHKSSDTRAAWTVTGTCDKSKMFHKELINVHGPTQHSENHRRKKARHDRFQAVRRSCATGCDSRETPFQKFATIEAWPMPEKARN